jgi:hypothetical protein
VSVGGVCAGIRPRRLVRLCLLLSTRSGELLWGEGRGNVCKWVGHGHAYEKEKNREESVDMKEYEGRKRGEGEIEFSLSCECHCPGIIRNRFPQAMTVITRESIAARILHGEHLFILNGELIRVSQQWLSAHPGGALAILHFVGRDATDEVEAYHSKQVLEKMRAFSQGPVQLSEDGWVPLLPPICTGWIRKVSPDGSSHWHNEAIPDHSEHAPSSQILLVKKSDALLASGPSLASIQPPSTTLSLKTQSQHSAAYKELHRRVVAAGLYRTRYISGYGPEVARYILLSLSSCLLYQRHLYFLSAVCLGALWHQLVFTCHDLGHVGVTHSWHRDRLIAIFLTDFIGGISIGWWVNVCPFGVSLTGFRLISIR